MGGKGVVPVVACSDCALLRVGIQFLGAASEYVELRGLVATPEEIRQLLVLGGVAVALLDYGLPDDGALALCHEISQLEQTVAVLIFAGALTDDALHAVVEAGAQGYLSKDAELRDVEDAIRRLSIGETVLDAPTERVVSPACEKPSLPAALSARELDIVRRVARGESNKEIAKRLGLSQNTVKTYLRRVYRKLGCETRSAAAALIARTGLA